MYAFVCEHTFGFAVKLSEWARSRGLHPQTAYKWFHAGTLPVPARQLPSGTILVEAEVVSEGRTVVYARVSSHDQIGSLDAQVFRTVAAANAAGLAVDGVVAEVGSGLNGRRRKLARLLADPEVGTIVVEHRDRLARFGVEHLEAALAAAGRRIVIADDGETDEDLVRDMVEVLTLMCARLYGRRGARNRAQKALRCAAADVGPRVVGQGEADG